MAQSYPDFILTGAWQDVAVAAGYTAIANQKTTLQSKGGTTQQIYFGGSAAPSSADGVVLNPGQSVSGTSDHIWVKGSGKIAVLVED